MVLDNVLDVSSPIEMGESTGAGLWRPAGLLDRWRLRNAPTVAVARVRSEDALPLGAVLVVTASVGDVWVRVDECTASTRGAFEVRLAVLGPPS